MQLNTQVDLLGRGSSYHLNDKSQDEESVHNSSPIVSNEPIGPSEVQIEHVD